MSRGSARRVDADLGWVARRFREIEARFDGLDTGKLSSVPGSAVTIQQLLSDPSGSTVGFHNEDSFEATADDTAATGALTYLPIAGSLHVRQNGVDLAPDEWVQSGQSVTVAPSAEVIIRDGHVFTTAYAYDPTAPVVVPSISDVGTYDEEVMADAPYLYLHLDEASGSTAADSSGNGRDFTATSVTWAQGSLLADGYGSSASFNGTSGYLARATEAGMEVQDFTVSFLYQHDAGVDRIPYVGRWLAGGSRPWLIAFDGTNIGVGINNSFDIIYPWSPVDGQVYHVALKSTFGTAALVLLIDGIPVATANGSVITNSGSAFEIGRSSGTSFQGGQVSRVAFWTTYLSDDRLATHYQAAITP